MIDRHETISNNTWGFHLPKTFETRLQVLLARQDNGEQLTSKEKLEAEALVELAEFLSLLQLRTQRQTINK